MNRSFTVQGHALATAVRYVARWLPGRPTIPIHAGILAEVDGDRLHLFGFNETATGRATVEIDARDEPSRSFVVSGRLLDSIVATLGDKPVRFEQDGSAIDITSGRFRAALPMMAAEDYPALPGIAEEVGSVHGGVLADAVRRVGVAASRDLAKQITFTGVYVTFAADGELGLLATDSYRVAQQSVGWSSIAPADDALVPAAVLLDAMEAFSGADEVTIGSNGALFSLSTPDRSLTVRTLDRTQFPAAQMAPIVAMPRNVEVTFRVKDAMLPLKRIDLLKNRESDRVDLMLTTDTLGFAADAGEAAGNGNDEIDAEYSGPETTLPIRSAGLRDALSTAPGDTVTLAWVEGAAKPVLFTSDADPTWRHVIVPLRIVGGTQ